MLRALVLVHGCLALGAGLGAPGWLEWAMSFAWLAAVALPGLLLWLAIGCLIQRAERGGIRLGRLWHLALPSPPLGESGPSGSFLLLVVLAAGCAWLPWRGLVEIQAGGASPAQALAVALTGAALASAFLWWLGQRARQRAPATASARLAELQSRIRPHFLFNTLNTAIALVRLNPAKAESVLEDLAELFRVALAEAAPDASATLGEEIELARRYLAIEQLRFGDRLDIRWELDPEADSARVPPLLLQPLLENAVRHGVEPSPEGGQIRVRTRVRRGQVEVAIVNSLPEGGSRPGHGLALQNVRERLSLMHDVAATFQARRDDAVYRVDIALPP